MSQSQVQARQPTQFQTREFALDLLRQRVRRISSPQNAYTCMESTGEGIDETPLGYRRVSFKGRKWMIHKLIHMALVDFKAVGEVSHLCSHSWCCNPQHLVIENRLENISRRGCLGDVFVPELNQWIRACLHNPPCKVSTIRNTEPAPEVEQLAFLKLPVTRISNEDDDDFMD